MPWESPCSCRPGSWLSALLGDDEGDGGPEFAAIPKISKNHLAAAFAPAIQMPGKCDGLVSRKTAAKVAPQAKAAKISGLSASDRLGCVWRSNDQARDVGGKKRVLQAFVTRSESVPGAMESFRQERDMAYTFFKNKTNVEDRRRPKPESLTGVGEEAIYYGTETWGAHSYVTVVFRVKNITVKVEYFGEDHSGGRLTLPPMESLRPRVFAAAVDAARNLGSTAGAEPKITKPAGGTPPLGKLPGPCGLVTKATLDKLGGPKPGTPVHKDRNLDFGKGLQSGTEIASCEWVQEAGLGGFTVASIRTPDEVPGIGADIAKRRHWSRFPVSQDNKNFSLLRGPGEEASIRSLDYENCPTRPRDRGCAELSFRISNVLATVWYAGRTKDGEYLSYDQMARRAYAVATDGARSMPR